MFYLHIILKNAEEIIKDVTLLNLGF